MFKNTSFRVILHGAWIGADATIDILLKGLATTPSAIREVLWIESS